MRNWQALVQPLPRGMRLLVVNAAGCELMRAHLPHYPDDPRALISVLEGLAKWQGTRLCVAIYADVPCSHSLGLGSFTDEAGRWPEPRALLHYRFVTGAHEAQRDEHDAFSDLRQIARSL